ncbi:hypothetical protein QEZ54_23190 [Catellatospora sp. KI3]|uniref:hypothetical protein n=1 Tax=Catellatospora sp. KI3 TaxID=3041620 RepID=UPI002482C470|nr:hypothetical protein [Catellatospora sp. KI3]MDI1463896.1 hypothetical protein [Catellatospora sp. KI3]
MNDRTARAMATLRAADPAPTAPDPADPQARALLERVLQTPDAPPPAPARGRRRLVVGVAGAAAFAAAAVFAVAQPAAAYTVQRNPDGTVAVVIRPSQLHDPDRLNAALARVGARTTVLRMVPADRCPTAPEVDPAFELPEDATPEQLAAQIARFPVDYRMGDEEVLITIRPWLIPSADSLALGYAFASGPAGPTTYVRPAVVRTMPACLPMPTPPRR